MSESTDIVLTEIGQRIRQIDKKILSIKRERAAALSRPSSPNKASNPSSRPTTAATNLSEAPPPTSNPILEEEDSAAIDPILELESEREKLVSKYEQLNDGNTYKPPLEQQIFDFCESLYREIERNAKDFSWISKYYDVDAYMNIVGLGTFAGREQVVKAIVRKYENLKVQHDIVRIQIDSQSTILTGEFKGAYICASITTKVKIDDDDPRKVLQIFEWCKSTEMTPYPMVIQKEYFVVQDARPLYHWPEKDKPLTKVEMMRVLIAENKLEAERLRLQQLKDEEEAKRREEEGEDDETMEDSQEEGEEDEDDGGAANDYEDGEVAKATETQAEAQGDENAPVEQSPQEDQEGTQ